MKRIKNIHKQGRLLRLAMAALVGGSVLLGACSKEEDGNVTLRVNTEHYRGVGKAFVDEQLFTCWSNNDAVQINGTEKTIFINTVGNETTCYINGVTPAESYWSIFPSSIATNATYSNGTIEGLTLPATQSYTVVDGKQMVPTVMTAYLGSRTGTISYHNACIALMITLHNNYSKTLLLNTVEVSDDQAPLNGAFRITGADGQTPALQWAGGTVAEANKRLTMDFGTQGLRLPVAGQVTFFVILPPTDGYTNNKFTIGVTATDDVANANGVTVYSFSHTQGSAANGTFARNQLAPIAISLNDPHTMVLKGLGTTDNPYQISTPQDLQSMQKLVSMGYEPIVNAQPFASATYQLMQDIDMTNNVLLGPIGTESNHFTGLFDGQNHTLSNPKMPQGLFGHVSGATIKDLKVNGATVHIVNATAGGVICARASKSVIDHCQVTGTVRFDSMPVTATYIGTIVGDVVSTSSGTSVVRNCHAGAQMTVDGATAAHRVGGIAGHLLNSALYNSYTLLNTAASTSHVIVAANAYVGGIVGRMDGDAYVVNCYYGLNDNIDGTNGHYADICGEMGGDAKLSKCYYRDQVSAIGTYDPDNLSGVSKYTHDGTAYRYQVNTTHVGTLLNQTVTTLGSNAMLNTWTEPTSTSQAPTLTY